MAPEDNRSAKIIRRWPGQGTCETYYETDDGRSWRSDLVLPDYSGATAPPRTGRIIGNRIYS